MVILELIHAPKPDFVEGLCLSDTEPTQALPGIVVIHNNRTNRMASAGDESFRFLTYRASIAIARCLVEHISFSFALRCKKSFLSHLLASSEGRRSSYPTKVMRDHISSPCCIPLAPL